MESSLLRGWPEPVVPVQSLSNSGLSTIPRRYAKLPADRPSLARDLDTTVNIPTIDLSGLTGGTSDDGAEFVNTARAMSEACKDWGIFQVVNHGVSPHLMQRTMQVWREFFHLPMEEKLKHANSPTTYEGYGSRVGVDKAASLDWGDYFFLHLLPLSLRDHSKWPSRPLSCREVTGEYGKEVLKVCKVVMRGLSKGLGLGEGVLEEAIGVGEVGTTLRVNYYPTCPQPELTLGLSAHSDPGALTVLLADEGVEGLQVRRGGTWVTVRAVRDAFVVNIGDQIQVLSNGTYKSVEHRAIVNSEKERISLAFFYNPKGDTPIAPLPVPTMKESPMYPQMTFDEYRLFIRKKGLHGKSQVESLKAN